MDWLNVAEAIKTSAGVVAVITAFLAYAQYRRSVRTKRAEWLDLTLVGQHRFITDCLKPHGFERLFDLLSNLRVLPIQ